MHTFCKKRCFLSSEIAPSLPLFAFFAKKTHFSNTDFGIFLGVFFDPQNRLRHDILTFPSYNQGFLTKKWTFLGGSKNPLFWTPNIANSVRILNESVCLILMAKHDVFFHVKKMTFFVIFSKKITFLRAPQNPINRGSKTPQIKP